MLRAGRSLTEPPGLTPSSLAKTRTPGRSRPWVTRVISSSGVLPISSSTLCARAVGTYSCSAAAGDSWDDGKVVAILDLRVELVEEADVVAVDVDVDEAAQFAFVVQQALADSRVAPFEVLDNRAHRLARRGDLVAAPGEPAQRRRNPYPD